MFSTDQLDIYLNDHWAGATFGVGLARRVRENNREEAEFAGPLSRICEEIEADRGTLRAVLEQRGIAPSPVKAAGAWVGEKLARLKPNGQLRGYAPLSRLLELEGLAMGITGKKHLWESLSEIDAAVRGQFDFEKLCLRAADQRAAVDDLHRIAAVRLAGVANLTPEASTPQAPDSGRVVR